MNPHSAGTDPERDASPGRSISPSPTRSTALARVRFPLALVLLGVPSWFLFGPRRDAGTVAAEPEPLTSAGVASELAGPEVELARASELRESGSLAEARTLLERVLALHPKSAGVRHELGLVLMEQGELEGAEALLAAAADAEPANAVFAFDLAQAVGLQAARTENPLRQLSLGTRSKKLLDRAIELDPTLVEARLGRILFYLVAPALLGGGIEKARSEVAAIAAVDACAGLFAEGWLAEEDGDYARGEELHRRAIALDPSQTRARFRLGYLQLGQERWAEAREQFEACRELEPRDPRSHQGLARAELGLGDVAAAIAGHQRALELSPGLSASIFGLAEAYAARGSADDAEGEREQWLELAREHFTRYLALVDEGRAADEARAWLAEH